MRYLKYMIIIAVLFLAACATEVIERPSNKYDGKVQIVGRVIPFADCDVDTRANKNDSEIAVNSVDYFIFNQSDICIFHGRMDNSDALSIDKQQIKANYGDISNCYIVTIANTNGYNITEGSTTWATLEKQTEGVTGVQIPENGLPMFGRHPETSGYFNLDEVMSGQLLTVPMVSLYSKIVVNISVDADQVLPGENKPVPTFSLTGCTVHNVASEVDFVGGTEGNTTDEISVNTTPYTVDVSGETVDGGTQITFSFYLPERFVKTATSASQFVYPFGTGSSIREEDKNYRQRYKPMLAKGHASYNSVYDKSKDKKATYATISGVYSDHQGHSYNVSYDIYVGNDNYSNFDVVRNRQYNNNIVIQGISNSSDQSTDQGAISIDHRVNVERLDPIIVNFRRETLLDSHFEVRPLRIRKNPKYTGSLINAKVKVEVEYAEPPAEDSNWIGLERSFGNGVTQTSSTTYLVDNDLVNNDLAPDRKNSAGKRKYFTTDLTTATLNSNGTLDGNGYSTAGGKTVVVPVTEADQCVWIYVDECTTAHDDVRTATIKVSYAIDGTNYTEPVEYVINQRELFPVTYNGHTYHIEYHEEYLHNYDSEDQFGLTEYEGMVWGLDGITLSTEHRALYMDNTGIDGFTWVVNNLIIPYYSPYYDYYLPKDLEHISNDVLSEEEKQKIVHDRQGHAFCGEIISETKTTANINKFGIGILDLGHDPQSAIEYCYNKNKRNSDGSVATMIWYLPAIDEMEDIAMGGYGTFHEFQAQDYWSSQPAFTQNAAHYIYGIQRGGSYMIDNINYARATSVEYMGGGAEDPNNYRIMESSMDDYYQILKIEGSGLFNFKRTLVDIPNDGYSFTYLGDKYVYPKYTLDKGYQPRTERNRIRCVRKMN